MKKAIISVLFLIPLANISAQWNFSLSMGLDFKSTPSFRDYINTNFAPSAEQLSSFTSSINFTGEVNYCITKNFQFGMEYSLLIDSYNTPVGPGGIYRISYEHHRPSMVGYYVLSGEGYQFKFGGGIGFRYITLSEEVISKENYITKGLGFLIRAEGNTLLSGNFFALICLDIRYDIPGELSSSTTTQKIINFANNEAVNLNSLSVGMKLGIAYVL